MQWENELGHRPDAKIVGFNSRSALVIEPSSDSAYLVIDRKGNVYTCDEVSPGVFVDLTRRKRPVGVEWNGIEDNGVILDERLPLSAMLRDKARLAFREFGVQIKDSSPTSLHQQI